MAKKEATPVPVEEKPAETAGEVLAKASADPEFTKAMDSLLKQGPSGPEEKKEESATVPATAVAEPAGEVMQPPPAISPKLLERAQEVGLDQMDLGDDPAIAEKVVAAAERAQLVAFRKHPPQVRQPEAPKAPEKAPEAPKAPRPEFLAKVEKTFDKETSEAFANLYESIQDHPHLKQLEQKLDFVINHLRGQQKASGENVIDEVSNLLAAEGYGDVLGTARPKDGSPQAQARYEKLAGILGATYRSFREQGLEFAKEDLEAHARLAAKKLWGERTKPAAKEAPGGEKPRDEAGKFVKPTVTARPSSRDVSAPDPTSEKERRSATENAVREFLAKSNGRVPDLHEMDM